MLIISQIKSKSHWNSFHCTKLWDRRHKNFSNFIFWKCNQIFVSGKCYFFSSIILEYFWFLNLISPRFVRTTEDKNMAWTVTWEEWDFCAHERKYTAHMLGLLVSTRVYTFLYSSRFLLLIQLFYYIFLLTFKKISIFQYFYFLFFFFNFVYRPTISNPNNSYKIINPKGIDGVTDLQKAAQIILESTGLDPESYRIGNTKACVYSLRFKFKFKEIKLIVEYFAPLTEYQSWCSFLHYPPPVLCYKIFIFLWIHNSNHSDRRLVVMFIVAFEYDIG